MGFLWSVGAACCSSSVRRRCIYLVDLLFLLELGQVEHQTEKHKHTTRIRFGSGEQTQTWSLPAVPSEQRTHALPVAASQTLCSGSAHRGSSLPFSEVTWLSGSGVLQRRQGATTRGDTAFIFCFSRSQLKVSQNVTKIRFIHLINLFRTCEWKREIM